LKSDDPEHDEMLRELLPGSRPPQQSFADCVVCKRLEARLDRLIRTHAEKVRIRREGWHNVLPTAHRRMRSAENDAMLKVEIARAVLMRHRSEEHGADE
jgi:hypothetical protein